MSKNKDMADIIMHGASIDSDFDGFVRDAISRSHAMEDVRGMGAVSVRADRVILYPVAQQHGGDESTDEHVDPAVEQVPDDRQDVTGEYIPSLDYVYEKYVLYSGYGWVGPGHYAVVNVVELGGVVLTWLGP